MHRQDSTQHSRRLRTPQAAEYIALTESTLEKDRVSGKLGIPFIKAGSAVIYDTADLDRWLDAHRVTSTSEAA